MRTVVSGYGDRDFGTYEVALQVGVTTPRGSRLGLNYPCCPASACFQSTQRRAKAGVAYRRKNLAATPQDHWYFSAIEAASLAFAISPLSRYQFAQALCT